MQWYKLSNEVQYGLTSTKHIIVISGTSFTSQTTQPTGAPTVMGRVRGGTAPWKCCTLFCALAVTVKCCWAGKIWKVGVVDLVVSACALRGTTKKGSQFFKEKSPPPV